MSQPSATSLQLLRLMADGGWHSGTTLAAQLGLSRAAVWKQLHSLTPFGINVEAQRPHGYRIVGGLSLIDVPRLQGLLAGSVLGRQPLLHFDSLPSTNTYLLARIGAGQGGGVCLAEHQSAGRGRRGRTWHSPFGRNLYLSVAHMCDNGPAAMAGLSLAIGAGLAQTLTALGVPDLALKWPNDLLCGGQKLAGILIELHGDTQGPCWVVVGIGLNVNMSSTDEGAIDQPWTSLARISGHDWDRTALAAQLLTQVGELLANYSTRGFAPWRDIYARFDGLADRTVQVDWAGERVVGVARGVDVNGALLVDCEGGPRALWGGEVTVRPVYGSAV